MPEVVYSLYGNALPMIAMLNNISDINASTENPQINGDGVCHWVLENSDDSIFVVNSSYEYIFMNRSYMQKLGVPEDGWRGRKYADFYPSDDVEMFIMRVDEVFFSGRTLRFEHKCPNFGDWFLKSISPVRGAEGKIQAVSVILRDISEIKGKEAALKKLVDEKDSLVREAHHRIKNNLMLVDGLLDMQSTRAGHKEFASLIKDSQSRLRAVGAIHERLYRSNNDSQPEISEYLGMLAKSILDSFGDGNISLVLDIQREFMRADIAVACGMIVNELITNSLKHAFPNGVCAAPERACEIQVLLHGERQSGYRLVVRDNGVGMAGNFNIREVDSLGMRIVSMMTDQLKGQLQASSERGMEVCINFGGQ